MVVVDCAVRGQRDQVLVVDLGMDRVYRYQLRTSTGRLRGVGEVALPAGSGPRHLVAAGSYAYIAGELDSTVSVVDLEAAGGVGAVISSVATRPWGSNGISYPSAIRLSPDSRFSFWDLQDFERALRQRYSSAQLDIVGSHAVAHPVPYWQADFSPPKTVGGKSSYASLNADPFLYMDNPRADKTAVDLSLRLTSARKVPEALIRWPDGYVQTVALGAGEVTLSRRLDLPPGRSAVEFSVSSLATAVDATSTLSTFELTDPKVVDPVLETFPL